MSSRAWTVACLAGDGVGPELMAETSLVLAEVARLHAFRLDDLHLPFGGEALTRYGHPLPHSTRDAYLAGGLPTVASAWLSANGPGLFAPHVCDAAEVAGLGVADPVGTLLAASLLLGEGLGARSAARTLERAVAVAEKESVSDTRS